jgi:hypothetical protein
VARCGGAATREHYVRAHDPRAFLRGAADLDAFMDACGRAGLRSADVFAYDESDGLQPEELLGICDAQHRPAPRNATAVPVALLRLSANDSIGLPLAPGWNEVACGGNAEKDVDMRALHDAPMAEFVRNRTRHVVLVLGPAQPWRALLEFRAAAAGAGAGADIPHVYIDAARAASGADRRAARLVGAARHGRAPYHHHVLLKMRGRELLCSSSAAHSTQHEVRGAYERCADS